MSTVAAQILCVLCALGAAGGSSRTGARGRGRSNSGASASARSEPSNHGRGSKRRRASPNQHSSYSYAYGSEAEEDEDLEEGGGMEEEERREEDARFRGSLGGGAGGGANRAHTANDSGGAGGSAGGGGAAQHSNGNGRKNRPKNGDYPHGGFSNGHDVPGGSGSNDSSVGGGYGPGKRGVSRVIEEMLGHQGDMLDRYKSRALILRFAREKWEEPPPPVDINLAKVADFFLGLLGAVDEEGWFAVPVAEDAAPGYIAAILRPMDLGTMRARAERRGYRSVTELQDDLLLILANCISYNSPDSVYTEAAISLAEQARGAYMQSLAAVSASNGWGSQQGAVSVANGGGSAGRSMPPAPAVAPTVASAGATSASGTDTASARGAAGAAVSTPGAPPKRKRGRPRKHPLPS